MNELTDVLDKIQKKMDDLLKSSEHIVQLAFAESFESKSYENVYKYVVDIQRYCLEIIHKLTNSPIDLILSNSFAKVRGNFTELVKNLRSFDFIFSDSKVKLHDVLLKLINSIKESENLIFFADLFENISIHERYENIEISSFEDFKSGINFR